MAHHADTHAAVFVNSKVKVTQMKKPRSSPGQIYQPIFGTNSGLVSHKMFTNYIKPHTTQTT
jgi:hypothetical protein